MVIKNKNIKETKKKNPFLKNVSDSIPKALQKPKYLLLLPPLAG